MHVCQVPEPKTIEEALSGNQAKEWKAATDSEYQSLMENRMWELIELPKWKRSYRRQVGV